MKRGFGNILKVIAIRWQDVALLLKTIAKPLGVIGLLSALFLLAGMSHTDSGDSFQYLCEEGICADAYINVTTTYWNFEFEYTTSDQYIYLPENTNDFKGALVKHKVGDLDFTPVLYKKWRYGRKLWVNLGAIEMIVDTQPNVAVEWLVPTRGIDNWRPIKEGDTWDRGKINKIKLRALGIPENTIVKWSFILGEVDIDPYWFPYDYISTVDYEYTFANKAIDVTEWHMVNTSVKIPAYINITYESGCNETNLTNCYTPCLNMTNFTWCRELTRQVFDHYNYEWEMINTSYIVQEQVPDEQTDKILGCNVEGIYYPAYFMGCLSFYNNTLSRYVVPCGEHNFNEFPQCRDYEIIKESCIEIHFGDEE